MAHEQHEEGACHTAHEIQPVSLQVGGWGHGFAAELANRDEARGRLQKQGAQHDIYRQYLYPGSRRIQPDIELFRDGGSVEADALQVT